MPALYDAWRLAERFHYRHVDDFLADHSGADLTDMFAYLYRDDEVQVNRLIYAIVRAFGGGKTPEEQEERVFDTTDPSFAKNFQGFI